jgi:hypothetical protein
MANTFVAIQTITVPATPANTIVFSSIPQTYNDLMILLSARSSRVGDNDFPVITFNGSSSGFDSSFFYATSGGAAGFQDSIQAYTYVDSSTFAANTFSNTMFYIPRYSEATIAKSFMNESVVENTSTDVNKYVLMTMSGKTSSTAAISSIQLRMLGGVNNFTQHTTATLYGISNT